MELRIASPVGELTLRAEGGALTRLDFSKARADEADRAPNAVYDETDAALLGRAAKELNEYFAGERKTFDLPLQPRGTEFQQAVWRALELIPYGERVSYIQIARAVGRPKACRAVGMANHANPLPIFLPCHRVVGKTGALTGYGGGLKTKEFLLDLEDANR